MCRISREGLRVRRGRGRREREGEGKREVCGMSREGLRVRRGSGASTNIYLVVSPVSTDPSVTNSEIEMFNDMKVGARLSECTNRPVRLNCKLVRFLAGNINTIVQITNPKHIVKPVWDKC